MIVYFQAQALDEEKYDLVREGVVIFTGALAKHLAKVCVLITTFLGISWLDLVILLFSITSFSFLTFFRPLYF